MRTHQGICVSVDLYRTEQHIEEPGVEVAEPPGVLANTDSGAGCCPPDGRGAGLQVGHKWL